MECEICGLETDDVKTIDLDGSSLIVCPACASYGKEVEENERPKRSQPAMARTPIKTIGKPFYQRQELDLGLEIVPDFGKVVRRAREKKDLTVKELAMKVFEKESLLHRIENQSIAPSEAIIAKLEKQLGIKLKQRAE